jgi:hypothetical protein
VDLGGIRVQTRYPTCHQQSSRRSVLIFLIKIDVLCD